MRRSNHLYIVPKPEPIQEKKHRDPVKTVAGFLVLFAFACAIVFMGAFQW